jgi:hypothetical protein
MRTWTSSSRALLLLGIAIFVGAAGAHAQQNPQRIALKSGESAVLRNYFFIVNCRSILVGTPVLEVLEGPDEVTVEIKEGPVLPRAQNCPKPVPGGTVVATAKAVTEPKEAKLAIRLKFNTKAGDRQGSNTYILSLFPAKSSAGEFLNSAPTNPAEPTQPASPN